MSQGLPLLYDYWRSSASYRVRIALALKGMAFERCSVDLLKNEQKAVTHLARNPQGLVPALAIDGLLLTQSLAIIDYLDETRPEPPLLPQDAAGRARVRALAHAIAMEIHPICNPSVVARVLELAGGEQEMRQAWMQEHIARGLDAVERLLQRPETGAFCHGDAPGLADCCLVPQLYNARRWGLEVETWPRITEIDANCADLPAFQSAHPDRFNPETP